MTINKQLNLKSSRNLWRKTVSSNYFFLPILFAIAFAMNVTSFAQISQFPYTEDFEGGLGDWTNAGGDDFDWTRDCCGTPSNNTGPASA